MDSVFLNGATYRNRYDVEMRWLCLAGLALASFGETRVVILGTGTPNADPERSGPCVAIVVNDTPYLVDMGPGLVRRAAAAKLSPTKLSRAFVTHLHSDHTAGFADLLLSPWVLERKVPLSVYGPKGLAAMARHIQRAYNEDIQVRLRGGEPSNRTGYRVQAREIAPGIVYRDQNVTVTAFAVPHGAWKHSFGYRFESPERTIVISGDTAPTDAVVNACNGCDVLVHEVYSAEMFKKRPPEWQAYHSRYHTSTTELAKLATRARPKLLVLYHQLYWGATDSDLLREVQTGYTGKVVSGADLQSY
jgi:ribonuclease BN (tRNA processing enzyme)